MANRVYRKKTIENIRTSAKRMTSVIMAEFFFFNSFSSPDLVLDRVSCSALFFDLEDSRRKVALLYSIIEIDP